MIVNKQKTGIYSSRQKKKKKATAFKHLTLQNRKSILSKIHTKKIIVIKFRKNAKKFVTYQIFNLPTVSLAIDTFHYKIISEITVQ